VLAVKKFEFETKPLKRWMTKEVNYDGDNIFHPLIMFWQLQYKKWRLCEFFGDLKVLMAHDLVEILFMRLSFHLQNEKLLQAF